MARFQVDTLLIAQRALTSQIALIFLFLALSTVVVVNLPTLLIFIVLCHSFLQPFLTPAFLLGQFSFVLLSSAGRSGALGLFLRETSLHLLSLNFLLEKVVAIEAILFVKIFLFVVTLLILAVVFVIIIIPRVMKVPHLHHPTLRKYPLVNVRTVGLIPHILLELGTAHPRPLLMRRQSRLPHRTDAHQRRGNVLVPTAYLINVGIAPQPQHIPLLLNPYNDQVAHGLTAEFDHGFGEHLAGVVHVVQHASGVSREVGYVFVIPIPLLRQRWVDG
mmetsp:Transcript_24658/g.47234  ORF Transcript_24658/g.47234 Transcript_24658/m.47234 type:complete len:275 (-) Transcript_24658:1473-2297(-)